MSENGHAYLHVKIQLVRGKHAIFMTAMGEMAPVLETYGWHLVGAFTPVVGRLGAVYHVWRVPSADGVLSALDRVRAHPDARRWHDAFAESIEDEALELVRPTSYSRMP
jgi:hypothetical protein